MIKQRRERVCACCAALWFAFFVVFGAAIVAPLVAPPFAFAHREESEAPRAVRRVLASRSVSSIVQDKYGFLWFGTDNGLFRWDGARMDEFYRRSGGNGSLPDNAILHLHEDKRGTLWIASAAGLTRFRRRDESFVTVVSGASFADIHEERSGALWLWGRSADARSNVIYRFDPGAQVGGETFVFSEGANGLKSAYLYAFLEDASGAVWLGTANGLHCFDRASKTFTAQMTDAATLGSPARAPEAHILSLAEDAATGTLLVGSARGIRRAQTSASGGAQSAFFNTFSPFVAASAIPLLFRSPNGETIAFAMQPGGGSGGVNKGVFVRLFAAPQSSASASSASPSSMQTAFLPVAPLEGKAQTHRLEFDAQGNAYWCLGNGVAKFTASSGVATLLFADSVNPARIHSPVACARRASSGALWFGRSGVGSFVIPPPGQPFGAVSFDVSRALQKRLLSPRVGALGESPDGAVWIGYEGGAGVSRLNPQTMELRHFRQTPSNPASVSGYAGETTVRAFLADKRGSFWAAASALDKIIGGSKEDVAFQHTVLLPGAFVSPTALVEASTGGALWVGSAFGLFFVNAEGVAIRRLAHAPGKADALGDNNIHALAKDAQGCVWVAHDAGVDKLDGASGRRRAYYGGAVGLPFGAATALLVHSQGKIWIGFRSGAAILNPATNKVERVFGKNDGLPDEAVAAICEDARGRVWISCRRGGLCRYEPETDAFAQFSLADGLADDEFTNGAALRTRDGKLWFGARTAAIYFHPDSLVAVAPPVHALVTGLKKFGARAPTPEYIAELGALELGYEDKVVAFEFAAPNAFYGENLRFAYKLEGLDTAWTLGGAEREAKYTNLPAGEYRFCVKAANHNGVWQGAPTSLSVIVRPPWWLSWQFIVCAFAFVSGAAAFGYKRRIRNIVRQKETLERLVAERTGQLERANAETRRQLEITSEQARAIDEANKNLHIVNDQLDATLRELRQTQTQLVQSERLNVAGMLTAGVMHEINNPNASIHSALELLERHLRTAQEYFLSLLDEQSRASREAQKLVEMFAGAGDMTRVALNGSNRILTIVQALQGFTKHQSEGATVAMVGEEIQGSVEMARYQFKDVETSVNISPRLALRANWSEMNQAILNILVNAAQAGATKIEISAGFDDEKKVATLRVADNGAGMDEITAQRIFEPFFTTKKAGNSGLGLSIARQIIERRGGAVRVQSRLGEGTTFTITLPEKAEQ